MRNYLPAFAFLSLTALSAPADASPWSFEATPNASALVFGIPATDRDAFRFDCSGGKMTISTWAGSPPRGLTEGTFPTRLSVFFGRTELVFTATGRVTGPGGATRIDARITDPAGFLNSLGKISRLTTVIFAGRRMAATPSPNQTAEFRKACGF